METLLVVISSACLIACYVRVKSEGWQIKCHLIISCLLTVSSYCIYWDREKDNVEQTEWQKEGLTLPSVKSNFWCSNLFGTILQHTTPTLKQGFSALFSNFLVILMCLFLWQSQFVPQFTEEKLESLLGSISQGLPSSAIIPWLQDDLVPFVSKVLPQGLVGGISMNLFHFIY